MGFVRKGAAIVNGDKREFLSALERKEKRLMLQKKLAEIDDLKKKVNFLETAVLTLQQQINELIENQKN